MGTHPSRRPVKITTKLYLLGAGRVDGSERALARPLQKSWHNSEPVMKNPTQVISTILATAAIGAALSKLSSAPITAAVNGEVILAVAASAAVVLFAAYDYARRMDRVQAISPVLRPALPAGSAANAVAYAFPRVRRSAIIEHAA